MILRIDIRKESKFTSKQFILMEISGLILLLILLISIQELILIPVLILILESILIPFLEWEVLRLYLKKQLMGPFTILVTFLYAV